MRPRLQVFLFLNAKCKRLFNNKLKASKLAWTALYRKAHKKARRHAATTPVMTAAGVCVLTRSRRAGRLHGDLPPEAPLDQGRADPLDCWRLAGGMLWQRRESARYAQP
jgi:hypothetical protein